MSYFLSNLCNFWNAQFCCFRSTEQNAQKNQIKRFATENQSMIIEQESPRKESLKKGKIYEEKIEEKKKRQIKVWTPEEDRLLYENHEKYGDKWEEISKNLIGRNSSQCSQRWRRKFKPERKRKNWTEEEDQLLKSLEKKMGTNWQGIANEMKRFKKTGKQIRERWLNVLDPKIKKQSFTEEEDEIIINLYKKIGKKWSEISKSLDGRPENVVKNRFYSCLSKKLKIKEESENSISEEIDSSIEENKESTSIEEEKIEDNKIDNSIQNNEEIKICNKNNFSTNNPLFPISEISIENQENHYFLQKTDSYDQPNFETNKNIFKHGFSSDTEKILDPIDHNHMDIEMNENYNNLNNFNQKYISRENSRENPVVDVECFLKGKEEYNKNSLFKEKSGHY